MFKFIKEQSYRKCYEEHGNDDGWTCYGVMGGDWSTGYLSENCIDCPYWVLPSDKKSSKTKVKKVVRSESFKPLKSADRDRSGEHYWMCPHCKTRVGGYVVTGNGPDDWCYEKDKFCKECGTQIDWT